MKANDAASARYLFLAATVAVVACFTPNVTLAASPALQPLLKQLHVQPTNDALRKKIIRVVLGMPSPPKMSDAVEEKLGSAEYAFKHANSKDDFAAAAQNFAEASNLAPWLAYVYYDMALSYEKAEQFDSAIKSLNWYLIAAPNARDAESIRRKIGGLKYAASHANPSPAPVAIATPTPAPQVKLACLSSDVVPLALTLDVSTHTVVRLDQGSEHYREPVLQTDSWSEDEVSFNIGHSTFAVLQRVTGALRTRQPAINDVTDYQCSATGGAF